MALSELRVRQMRVIWRDTFIVENHMPRFLEASRDRLVMLPCYVADRFSKREQQPDMLRVIERVSRSMTPSGYEDLYRLQLAPFEMADLRPTLQRLRRPPDTLTPDNIRETALEADKTQDWVTVTPMLLLHRAGVGIMEYYVTFEVSPPGSTPSEAIEFVRMGIAPQLLNLPDAWRDALPEETPDWRFASIVDDPLGWLMIGDLRSLSQRVIAARLETRWTPSQRKGKGSTHRVDLKPPRPTGSMTVVLVESDPMPTGDFPSFVKEHAIPLRGIGAMDTYYTERAAWLIERELSDNLSADSEVAVYLLGHSELMLYNDQHPPIVDGLSKRLRVNVEHATTYNFMHYGVLIEWTYLQDAILRAYLQRLDELAASPRPRRREMINTLQGALADLIQYQEHITPFATRIEFLERARNYHKLDQLAERFERKQALLLNYASEYHDFREARASEFLNWLAGILTGAALADLIITLVGITPTQTVLYLSITLGSIALVLFIMAMLLRLRR